METLKILFIQKVKGWIRKKIIPEILSGPCKFLKWNRNPHLGSLMRRKLAGSLHILLVINCLCFKNMGSTFFFLFDLISTGGEKKTLNHLFSPATQTQSETIKNIIAQRKERIVCNFWRLRTVSALLPPVEVVDTFCSFPLLPALLFARSVLFVLEAPSVLVPLLGAVITLMFPVWVACFSCPERAVQPATGSDGSHIHRHKSPSQPWLYSGPSPSRPPLIPPPSAGLWSDWWFLALRLPSNSSSHPQRPPFSVRILFLVLLLPSSFYTHTPLTYVWSPW